jgi:hypothetical protein
VRSDAIGEAGAACEQARDPPWGVAVEASGCRFTSPPADAHDGRRGSGVLPVVSPRGRRLCRGAARRAGGPVRRGSSLQGRSLMPLGASWKDQVTGALDRSTHVLVLIGDGGPGEGGEDADPVVFELEQAFRRKLSVIPIRRSRPHSSRPPLTGDAPYLAIDGRADPPDERSGQVWRPSDSPRPCALGLVALPKMTGRHPC